MFASLEIAGGTVSIESMSAGRSAKAIVRRGTVPGVNILGWLGLIRPAMLSEPRGVAIVRSADVLWCSFVTVLGDGTTGVLVRLRGS